MWEFKKTFYGRKGDLNPSRIAQFLKEGYYLVPYTIYDGWYRSVDIAGDWSSIYQEIRNPFPDILQAQNPRDRFALHLSGGLDSAILARLYDRADADYIHVGTVESEKTKILAGTLQGRFHHLEVAPEEFLATAEDILPRYAEPEQDAAGVLAYIASKCARQLGHTLIVTGDCGDTIFGGHLPRPHSEKAMVIWKTLHPNQLLGLNTLMPFGHPALKTWARATLRPEEYDFQKSFLRGYCRTLHLPPEITEQKKIGWGGCWDYPAQQEVALRLEEAVRRSKYRWIRDTIQPGERSHKTLFREFSLVRWLEHND